MKEPQLSGIAKALAAHGRKGDTELVHVSKKELETLEKYGEGLGIHLTRNPQTGLPEAFNWGGMLGSVALPLILTVATGGAAAPWMLAAAGAAGGFGGTMAGGGSTDEALMSGVMGGIGGYGMGSLAGNVAQAGVEQASAEALAQAGTQAAVEQGGTQALSASAPGVFSQGLQQGAQQGVTEAAAQTGGQTALQQITQGATQNSGILNTLAQQGGENLATEGMSKAAGSVVGGSFVPTPTAAAPLQSTPMTGLQQMSKGWEAISGSPQSLGNFAWDNAKNIGMAGVGAIGAGMTMNPQEQTITTESETDTSNPYTAEWYIDPATGQRRTRAVRAAAGGTMFSDYDAADVGSDGGYAPGGVASYALGGGIGDLGGYSDGGRTLRGPGDGVSDSIPATIEGKRPARLADGEFVVPARAVSELGNGSTEAGSKQLYKMLDRIAAKRKSGKGLAYQANPKKLLPA